MRASADSRIDIAAKRSYPERTAINRIAAQVRDVAVIFGRSRARGFIRTTSGNGRSVGRLGWGCADWYKEAKHTDVERIEGRWKPRFETGYGSETLIIH